MSHAGELDRHPTADDRTVEALLASVRQPCTTQQLACALGWTLRRTRAALGRLHAQLANTGQTLQVTGHHTYTLAARPGIVDDAQIARCLHQHRQRLDPVTARVLHRALTRPGRERAFHTLHAADERAAAERLIAAGIIEQKGGMLRPTARTEATFGARPNDRRVAIPSLKTLLDADIS